ncbi:MAG: hypothetical protein L0H83_05955, partial [Salinisphaera sp.]|nr:hypothetical protein [Salinisphaera sp.]
MMEHDPPQQVSSSRIKEGRKKVRSVAQPALLDRTDPPDFRFRIVPTAAWESLARGVRPAARIVAVCAPTGYGKTVLMTELFRHFRASGTVCFWVSLQEQDRSIARVLRATEHAV